MEFYILGRVEIFSGDRSLEIRGSIQRQLLTALLANEGRPVTTSALIEELWGERSPRNSDNALQAHVSRLRRRVDAFEPDAGGSRMISFGSRYQLRLVPEELDATRFLGRLQEVRSRPDMPPAEAVRKLREALSLWQGSTCDLRAGGPISQAAAARYGESRVAMLELLFDHELNLGRHAEIISELRELTLQSGLNERLCGQLMVALYRAGRQSDALDVYRQMWARLKDEVGVEPSPALKRYERAILNHHPVLYRSADPLALGA